MNRARTLRLALALTFAASLGFGTARPARADNETTYDRCGAVTLKISSASGDQKPVSVPAVGRSGLLPIAAIPANSIDPFSGPTTIVWSCGDSKKAGYTRCSLQTVAFEVIRSGQDKFRVDCYDAAGVDAVKSAH